MEITQFINEIKSKIECKICFEKFIKLTNKQYDKFCKDNEYFLPETFEDDNCCRCYEDRFECLICKIVICQKCYWSFKNHKFKPREDWIDYYKASGNLDDDGMVEGCPGEECPIICPFCRTKDYKIFYGNQMPYELLNAIKKGVLNDKRVDST
jgi:hypothetical protein